ncbi:phenylalanine--tRNA ligase subunit beta [Thermaerobacter sp. PB12/4term]|uniref:phenylalanine--tRNA ligase subunit beta n=1 Tax=Thermaerobacter sp. PB12/4term TaxID=2293838 RepID=UPI000E32A74F|nr:phenylalanine--tRNA ligase subunit beta [Thermaerobacter sp. PB12/4term]QIA26816.1 phenylalanine--tRNA ligase subunit beta [Thermaerobacter sp. PB12/4term]
MRVPVEWLRDFIDVEEDARTLAERLTALGLEVEAVAVVAPEARGVVSARVEAVEAHPEAAGLKVCRVAAGPAGRFTVVTGAPNVRPGMAVAMALPGAVLPGGMDIGVRDVRGVASEGMLCSIAELGLGDQPADRAGLADLEDLAGGDPAGVPAAGADLAPWLGWTESVLELSLTPNYAAHCQSILGIARELAAATGRPWRFPWDRQGEGGPGRQAAAGVAAGGAPAPEAPGGPGGGEPGRQEAAAAPAEAFLGGDWPVRVRIADPEGCGLYVARILLEVRPGGSPLWLRRRLVAAGMRPIDRIVDVTNYVMLELGQPLHAFDAEAVGGGTVVVRSAAPGEVLETLDGRRRTLAEDDLVIADASRPIGLAGVMGGGNSEITPATRVVLLESAWFEPRRVRRTARRHGLLTEAAQRFEKGVDPEGVVRAADRAMDLFQQAGAGRAAPGAAVARARAFPERRVPWRPQRLRQWLGVDLDDRTMAGQLERLGFAVDPGAGQVRVPSYRTDIEGEVDLAEEVGRVYGLDRIPALLPGGIPAPDQVSPRLALTWQVREALARAGAQEVVSWAFTRPAVWDGLRLPADHPWRRAIPLLHPLAEEHSLLRTTLLPGLLDVLAYNARRQQAGALVYEAGAVFVPEDLPLRELPAEPVRVGLAGYGELGGLHWAAPPVPVDFFTLKGVLEALLDELGIPAAACRWEPVEEPWLHPGRAAGLWLEGRRVGWLGELHPQVAAAWDLAGRAVAAELDLEALLPAVQPVPAYRPVARFPAVRRDIAVLAPQEMPAAAITQRIRQAAGPLLEAVHLFDRYTGQPVPEGQVSLAFALVYRAADRTLTDEEVDGVHGRVRQALADMGLTPRS